MFREKRNSQNEVVKASAKFGRNKEFCITPFNGDTYIHISDVKNCFSPGGEFDLSKSKSISLKKSEMEEMVNLSKMVDHYHKTFWQDKAVSSHEPNQPSTSSSQLLLPQRQQQQQQQLLLPQHLPQQQLLQQQLLPKQQLLQQQQQQQQQQQEEQQQINNYDLQLQGDEEIFYAIPVTLPE